MGRAILWGLSILGRSGREWKWERETYLLGLTGIDSTESKSSSSSSSTESFRFNARRGTCERAAADAGPVDVT